MVFYLLLAVAAVVGVIRAQKRIAAVEGPGGAGPRAVPRTDRWQEAPSTEKAAFVVMAVSAVVWLLLILTAGFAVAVAALGYTIWKRPYLSADLAPVALSLGLAVAVVNILLWPEGFIESPGAAVLNLALFAGPWLAIGALLWATARNTGQTARR